MGKKVKVKAGILPATKSLIGAAKDGIVLAGVRELPDVAGMVGFPKYQGPLDKIVTGGLLYLFKSGGKGMMRVGFSEGVANLTDAVVEAVSLEARRFVGEIPVGLVLHLQSIVAAPSPARASRGSKVAVRLAPGLTGRLAGHHLSSWEGAC